MSRTSSWSSSRKRSTRPWTRTRSPRSKRPASTSASRNARPAIAPEASRSSSARYGEPERATSRSLRVQAYTPSISCPGRSVAMAGGVPAGALTGGIEVAATRASCTLNRMQPLIWDRRPDGLRAPALVCAVKGGNDAGDAASAALTFVGASLGATRFAQIDPEDFYDFQATRPRIELVDGRHRQLTWPSVEIWEARVPRAPRDLILLSGPEPSMRWRTFCQIIVELAEALDTQLVVTLGALLADVPHSRPVGITGFATDERLQERSDLHPSSYEGPTGITGVLHGACSEAGLPSASLWA